jgi:hypothetical protein
MTIQRISSATNNGTTITLGTHAKGDLIVYVAANDAATIATLPSGVSFLVSRSDSGASTRVGYYIADSSSETVGTSGWANADNVTAIVYRAASGSIIHPRFVSQNAAGSSATLNFANQNSITGVNSFPFQVADLWHVGIAFQINTTNDLGGKPPTGMSNVIRSITSTAELAVHDTNATATAAWPSTNVFVPTPARYQSYVLELLEIETKIAAGGGGTFNPLQHPLIG